jgi:hemolysin III
MSTAELEKRIVYYSKAEEIANRLTHGAGALLSLIGVSMLIALAIGQHDTSRVVAASIYGGSMVTFYSLSTAYHSVSKPVIRYVFRILDHSAIFIMIAGSYTPFSMITLRGPWGWSILGIVWGVSVLGIVLKIFTVHRLRYLGPLLYIALGWLVLIALKPLTAALAANGVALLFWGGGAYTVGVLFYLWDRIPFNHAIWHLFVLAGSACHFGAIFYYVTPRHL